ncbi:hypothetical protein CQW49_08455 [Methylosinus trichosporium OB3b]|uniref:Resolvase HTH domain-containing protein n=1 Tax=Methylosinus trichosporium (strain ATCC 35070 / NCIMB 11131 / UNIQEM 75 / OB3b) TaxID=595536 RepID=A0A2D2CYU8_METT3|nr:hypothetical protein CQW49_08455 [Methylosinus trichosporium OB3b]OBS54012.1 hypothetical protein A8B73_02860 [Methylosinus sp. 3S-1]
MRLGANGHTIAGIAGRLGVTRETVYEWARRHPEFSDALQRSKAAAVAFYESRLIHIAQHGGGVGSAAACIFALKARASHEWLPPRAPDISELPDDSSQMRDVTPDPEATEEQISVVQRALALHVAMDEREITDELLHDVAVAPIAADHGPEYAHPGTSVGKALEWLKAKSGGRGNVFSAVDASIEAHRRKNATAPAAAPAAAPAPPAQPIADDALEILPPKSRVGRIIDI